MFHKERGVSKAILIDVHCENFNRPHHSSSHRRKGWKGGKMGDKVPDLLLRKFQEVFNERDRCVISRRYRRAA
jgi:hypothetical protein